ncbi:uncharacterized protein LOC122260922 isoform X1 [Penaeus japonicus]|uniref:uncharacterized protein LOC122260922 isoform X1 n=1 Tax=Penaeus japonicus TaxID=27405 RepID=UPI001C7111ED|nr:uncharacterized protein LOC122260922 isoform X1 [Penaeus japonicus]XP_042884317.1 uncharacterized protein LOC122260922 isoform X1 [Penaeus japonicus]XP_042884318.1 uncharacterized protein LOC122260922 isoform X1 [Penaeus japonicus]XP_042884320.1 uncharacterized protein LOC122260922 isoform X1 [Penaeus japonicus]XP_042884321.1 uncharacterized protein LOC122260922 isoform X1 [Penaeus japonicus]
MEVRRGQASGRAGGWRRRWKSGSRAAPFLLVLIMLTLAEVCPGSPPGALGIDCFKCVSVNGDNPGCEDPFHNNFTVGMLESPCMAGRKGREGLFPATACIKLAGIYDDTGQSIMVRACALDSGTLTTDTEIIRMSHCGGFYFEHKYVKGCLQSCDDSEGCNGAPSSSSSSSYVTVLASLALLQVLRIS